MKLSEWIKINNIPNNRILKVLEDYENIEPIRFNEPEDVKREVEENGLRWVANKYGVSEKELKEYGTADNNRFIACGARSLARCVPESKESQCSP